MIKFEWVEIKSIDPKSFTCFYCNNLISSDKGIYAVDPSGKIFNYVYICPHCKFPTFFIYIGKQIPAPLFGEKIEAIPNEDSRKLYDEIRDCISSNNYTAAVLCCRKLLMNIAVLEGAQEGESYKSYIDYLESKGFIPPNCKELVDYIREMGNIANHEIKIMSENDAKTLAEFISMLLNFIYTYPSLKNKYLKDK
jgi:nitrite reductase/ring-hydroxylating ferredoxin subunit